MVPILEKVKRSRCRDMRKIVNFMAGIGVLAAMGRQRIRRLQTCYSKWPSFPASVVSTPARWFSRDVDVIETKREVKVMEVVCNHARVCCARALGGRQYRACLSARRSSLQLEHSVIQRIKSGMITED